MKLKELLASFDVSERHVLCKDVLHFLMGSQTKGIFSVVCLLNLDKRCRWKEFVNDI